MRRGAPRERPPAVVLPTRARWRRPSRREGWRCVRLYNASSLVHIMCRSTTATSRRTAHPCNRACRLCSACWPSARWVSGYRAVVGKVVVLGGGMEGMGWNRSTVHADSAVVVGCLSALRRHPHPRNLPPGDTHNRQRQLNALRCAHDETRWTHATRTAC